MDALINGLYGIPLLGLVFQLAGYLVAVIPPMAPIILRSATPLALGAMCGVCCERSGVVNIGIEGTMLASAFAGWVVGIALAPMLGGAATPLFGLTLPLLIALVAALTVALVISALHAWLSISVRADQIISGTIINIAAFGVTGYLNTLISKSSPTSAGSFALFTPPKELSNLPVVGWLFDMFFNQGPIAMSVLILVVGLQIWLFRSRWGLRTRAVGEHPKAAETVGIDVIRLRYRNVLIGGLFAGLAGAYLSMEATNSFQAGMTAGRGFIALAAMIVGRWTPIGAFGAALLFAAFLSIGQAINFAPPGGDLGTIMTAVPAQVYDSLPYIVTIIVLAGVVGRSVAPAADGQPYERESAT
ncbi:MAG TPA: ABC transporter permease [Candidatus Limnocylindrales bacterium]